MKRFVCLALVLLAAGCSSPTSPESLTLVRLGSAAAPLTSYSGLRESQRLVIRDQATWQQTWSAIWSNTAPQPALPTIDFTREMVILAALGERPTGGYSIFVDSASETAAGVTIAVRSLASDSGCPVTLALTQPVDIARMTRRDGHVEFAETFAIQRCD